MPKLNFVDNPLPVESYAPSGEDFFSRDGSAYLLVDLISSVANDLQPGSAHYDETLEWVSDPRNVKSLFEMLHPNEDVIPILQQAFILRSSELKAACDTIKRSHAVSKDDNLTKLMSAMGMLTVSAESSMTEWNDFDWGEISSCQVA